MPTRRPSTERIGAAIVVAIVVVVAFLWFAGEQGAEKNRLDLRSELEAIDASRALMLDPSDHVVGNADAKVVVVEYFDLECPTCKQYDERRHYFESRFKDQDVAFVARHFPLGYLHAQAVEEAVALECAGMLKGSDGFFPYRNAVYANTEGEDTLDLSLLEEFAKRLRISPEDFSACRTGDDARQRVSDDIISGAIAGVHSTPSFVLYKNGAFQYVIASGDSIGWRNLELAIETLLQE